MTLPWLLISACGHGGDGGIDARVPRASIAVSNRVGPIRGVDVVFHDAGGAPLAHVQTDAAGRAEGAIEDGGMITVLSQDVGRRLWTFVDVSAGDALSFVDPDLNPARVVGTATVQLPAVAGAAWYDVTAATIGQPCNAGADAGEPPVALALDVTSHCLSPAGTLDLVATAVDLNGLTIGVSTARAVAWTDGAVIPMPAWGHLATLTVTGTRVPDHTYEVDASMFYRDGERSTAGPGITRRPLAGATTMMPLEHVEGLAGATDFAIAVAHGDTKQRIWGTSTQTRRWAVPPATLAIDLTSDLLPLVPAPTYDRSNPVRPAVTWTPVAPASIDGGVVDVGWRDQGEPFGYRWTLLVPPGGARVQVPSLPTELAEWAPGTEAVFSGGQVSLYDADWVSSYDQLRREIGFAFRLGYPTTIFPTGGVLNRTVSGAP